MVAAGVPPPAPHRQLAQPLPPPPPGRVLGTPRAVFSPPLLPPAGARPAPLAAIKWLVKEMQVSACGGAAAVETWGVCLCERAGGSASACEPASQRASGSGREMLAASAPRPAAPAPGGPSAWGSASP